MEYDDPQLGGHSQDNPTTTEPSASAPDPWSPEELAAARQWAQQYYTSHQIPVGYGEVQDLVNSYMGQRRAGRGHQEAMDVVPGMLGWDKYTPPATTTGGGGGGGSTGGGGGGGGATTTTGPSPFPTFTAPGFTPQVGLTAPNPYTFTPFSYQDFRAPTLEEARNQPGYQFGLQQGQDALQNSAAARGTLRGGGTLKDLFGYTNAAAEQNYGNVFNQQKSIYDTNRDNAFGTWAANNAGNLGAFNTNFGVAKDVNASQNAANQQNYLNAYQNAAGEFNPLFQASTLTFNDAYQRWLAKLNSLTNIATAGAS